MVEGHPAGSTSTPLSGNVTPPQSEAMVRKRRRSGSTSSNPPSADGSDLPSNAEVDLGTQVDDSDTYSASRFGHFGEYMRRKRAKLQIQNSQIEGQDKSKQIFHGLAVYINGWTNPSVQELRQLIIQHGGTFHAYLDKLSLVTHIVTNHLTPAKVREFQHRKVVRPDWLVQSARCGTLLPWTEFKWTPEEKVEPTQGTSSTKTLHGFFAGPSEAKAQDSTPVSPSNPSAPAIPETPTAPRYAAQESNPHAQRVMARPEWRSSHTAMAPDFLEGYYKHSRLHHLSTWKAELKGLVAEAVKRVKEAEERGTADNADDIRGSGSGVSMRGAELMLRSPSRDKKEEKGKANKDAVPLRIIMHCDFDCFFVSAGLVSRPHLRGKPVVVCHSQGATGGDSSTSEIASSSYEAREFGIKNGMSLRQARQLCPTIMTIPYEFERYKHFSLKFYTILMEHADELQAVSVDEALIEVTNSVARFAEENPDHDDPAMGLAELMRGKVRKATECEVSIGISHNIMLARLATRLAKPARAHHLLSAAVPALLATLDIKDLHGFGWSAHRKAAAKLGTTNLGELANRSREALCNALGRATGETVWKAVRGIDDHQLEADGKRKSVSCDVTYGVRFDNDEQVETFVFQLAEEVARRLTTIGMRGRSLTLKMLKRDPSAPVEGPKFLGHGLCESYSKQITLTGPNGRATSDERVIGEHAWRLLQEFKIDAKDLRGLSIQITKLEDTAAVTVPASVAPGQGVLPFKPLDTEDSQRQIVLPPPRVQDNSDDVDTSTMAGPSALELPSFSQVDMDVFDALPEDVRQELELEYRRVQSALPGPSGVAATPLASTGRKSEVPTKDKGKGKQPDLERITRQLAPRNRPVFTSPQKHPLFAKRKADEVVNVTDAELRKLDIDPSVFHVLPADLQSEQLKMARLAVNAGGTARFIGARKLIKPYAPSRSPSVVPMRRPPPRARHVSCPTLKQYGKTQGEKLCFSALDDVQGAIEKWVHAFRRCAPNERDVDRFGKYLVKCVEEGGESGTETAIKVTKWWLVLLRRFWEQCETAGEEPEQGNGQDMAVGMAWWQAFRNVKGKMDIAARRRFGGCLSLK